MKTASWEQIKTLLDSISKAIKKVFVSTENAQKTADKATAAAKDASQSAKKVKDALEAFNIKNGEAPGSLRTSNAAPNDDWYLIGENAFAMGENAKASGNGSFAFGANAEANVGSSVAIGDYANAGGGNYMGIAIGNNSIANNGGVAIKGEARGTSCAIGGAKVTADFSVAIGNWAEAASKQQVVLGTYNIVDTANKYVFIVGNGESSGKRANAFAVDRNGNAEANGLIIPSPNGTRYQVTVDDSGNLTAAKL